MPYESKAQQGYMHAAKERGEISPEVVKDFDEATTKKQYAHLPEHVRHAVGGFIRHLVRHYFGGGEAGLHHEGSEHDELRGSYEERDDHAACEHYAHGGSADEHDPSCPMAHGGQAKLGSGKRFAAIERSAAASGARDPAAVAAAAGIAKYGAHKMAKMAAAHRAHGGYMAQGGEAEEAEYRLEGGEREDERNDARSPLAEHLAGARIRREALRQILRRPATRVP